MPVTVPRPSHGRTGEFTGATARGRRHGGRMAFTTVDEVERARGPLRAADREIAYLYLDLGLTARECAARLYVSESAVLRRLAACGVARRPRGGSGPRMDPRLYERSAFLYVQLGLSLAAIAKLEGVYPNAVRHRLRMAGIALRSR
jgi:DNA-directed RNA polymerase specialized sigma24 family protein